MEAAWQAASGERLPANKFGKVMEAVRNDDLALVRDMVALLYAETPAKLYPYWAMKDPGLHANPDVFVSKVGDLRKRATERRERAAESEARAREQAEAHAKWEAERPERECREREAKEQREREKAERLKKPENRIWKAWNDAALRRTPRPGYRWAEVDLPHVKALAADLAPHGEAELERTLGIIAEFVPRWGRDLGPSNADLPRFELFRKWLHGRRNEATK